MMKTAKNITALYLLASVLALGCNAVETVQDLDDSLVDEGETAEGELALSGALTDILNEREGWGKDAIGGKNGTIYHVTNRNDSGSGSLRAGLESSGARWIVFDVEGDIVLQDEIRVKSYKTVDARDRYIQIRTKDQDTTAFVLDGVQHVIFINLELDNDWSGYGADATPEGSDAITIYNSSNIWIHHCEFKRWKDGAIDIKEYSGGSFKGHVEKVSVTWSEFRQIYQALLWEGNRLTLSHNVVYPGVGTRFPKIIKNGAGNFAFAHSYNNYIADWANPRIQSAKDGGQLYTQHNIYESGPLSSEVNHREGSGLIRNESPYKINSVTFAGGNNSLSSSYVSEAQSTAKLDVCSTSSCWTALKNRLLNGDATHKAAGATLFGGGGGTCAHDRCVTGAALADGCDSCVTSICAVDWYCCSGAWDAVCVGEVSSVCGLTCN